MKKLLLTGTALAIGLTAFAHSGAEGVVKDRMNAMKALGAVMSAVMPTFKSGDDFDIKAMKGQAGVMNTALVVIRDGFPEGSMSDVSEASEAIWEDPEGWASKMADLEAAVDEFTGGVELEDQDMMKAGFEAFAGTCKACHKEYRIEAF